MTVVSLACGSRKPTHERCSVAGCACKCHGERPPEPRRPLENGAEARAAARERANLALLEFTTTPDLKRTQDAIAALISYELLLQEARHGR